MSRKDRARAMRELLNGGPVGASPEVASDPELYSICQDFVCGDSLCQGDLPLSRRVMVLLAVFVALGDSDRVGVAVDEALNVGLTPEQVKETLYQCSPYCGLARVMGSCSAANEVFARRGIVMPRAPQATVTEENRLDRGIAVQREIFGERIDAMRASAPPELAHVQDWLSAYCFGDFYTRGTLGLADRELVTFSVIATLGGCEAQLKSHVAANVGQGNDRATLICAISCAMPWIGFPRTLNALSCIDEAT